MNCSRTITASTERRGKRFNVTMPRGLRSFEVLVPFALFLCFNVHPFIEILSAVPRYSKRTLRRACTVTLKQFQTYLWQDHHKQESIVRYNAERPAQGTVADGEALPFPPHDAFAPSTLGERALPCVQVDDLVRSYTRDSLRDRMCLKDQLARQQRRTRARRSDRVRHSP